MTILLKKIELKAAESFEKQFNTNKFSQRTMRLNRIWLKVLIFVLLGTTYLDFSTW